MDSTTSESRTIFEWAIPDIGEATVTGMFESWS